MKLSSTKKTFPHQPVSHSASNSAITCLGVLTRGRRPKGSVLSSIEQVPTRRRSRLDIPVAGRFVNMLGAPRFKVCEKVREDFFCFTEHEMIHLRKLFAFFGKERSAGV